MDFHTCHRGYASTLAKALDMFWWRRIRQDVNDYFHKCVVCHRAKERALVHYFFPLDHGTQLDVIFYLICMLVQVSTMSWW
jgi:hypothetical protein